MDSLDIPEGDITFTDRYACCQLGHKREQYCTKYSTQASSQLQTVADETSKMLKMDFMLSGSLNGQMLNLLATLIGARRILEIGTYTGYTALALAEALPPNEGCLVCVDDFSDEPESEAIARKALEQAPNASRIHIVRKPGRQALLDFARDGTEPFDFVFIDADKESQIYYYDTLLEKGLLSEHGLICVDNTLWYSKVVTGETDVTTRAVHDFNEHVARDPRTQKVIIPMRDGLTVIRRL